MSAKRIDAEDWVGQAQRLAAPPVSVRVEKLTPGGHGRRTYTFRADEPAAARLIFRVSPTVASQAQTFDFAVEIAAREYYGPGHPLPVGSADGAVDLNKPLAVEVEGTVLPLGLYRLLVRVDIYASPRAPDQEPLCSGVALGDLMHIIGPEVSHSPAS